MGCERNIDGSEHEPAAERARRSTTLIVADCLREHGATVRLRVRNLSATGLKALCPDVADFGNDEPVRIVFRGLSPIAADIIRIEGNELGIRFRNPVDVDRINRSIARTPLPSQSPRSEAISNWIDQNDRQRQWHKLSKGIRGPRPL